MVGSRYGCVLRPIFHNRQLSEKIYDIAPLTCFLANGNLAATSKITFLVLITLL